MVRQEVPPRARGGATGMERGACRARGLPARDQVIDHPAARTRGAHRWSTGDPASHRGLGAEPLTDGEPNAVVGLSRDGSVFAELLRGRGISAWASEFRDARGRSPTLR